MDTIAAQATPPGRGGIGVVRVSGAMARACAEAILGHCPRPRQAEYLPFFQPNGELLDHGIALWFPAPHSFTGEDVLELQGHGGPVVIDRLLQALQAQGVRMARPGEFSERAFLNGKLDLAQAEAIADLIEAGSEQAARSALRTLQGEFSALVHALVEQLTELRVYVEAAIDFSDEEIDFLGSGEVEQRLAAIEHRQQAIQQSARQGSLLREGMSLVIAGQPNAGKSSLLNALSGRDSAIVTEIAGTTRDVLHEQIQIDGLPLHIIDTAGLRETDDPVEQQGIKRAWQAIEQADRILLLVDDRIGISPADELILSQLPKQIPLSILRNKCDLSAQPAGLISAQAIPTLRLSAKAGLGMDSLRAHLKQSVGYQENSEGQFIARRRHLDALNRAAANLQQARLHMQQGSGELLAEELRLAQQALGEITGEVSSDALLGRIFSSFCIGK
ncbi:MAG: tRNA uridine-5-carboxymethylaminomethyl(34) synthesis GTPase MnmE [Chromatiales bacterium]|nr:tRNA uridine-5-carboxymethylaminomethyl(34) synthesis GTPase MnmE [Gammaproteobacteria bacterium]MBW6475950.1 tRNA uridine-5-carboxymethylaminomethyl(34) synthesis GTPase MnmE [Chromatiales bacterium]